MSTLSDTGSAYEVQPGSHDPTLTEVRRGTPMGELMRRYWHPIAPSSAATDLPKQVRVLGEDLILYRDQQGRPGLLHPRCVHRGSSLLYGRIDEAGIRCCYHGWAFDVEGRCTDQPCEPQGGAHRDKVRQPWYPAEDRYGLVWAYLGPIEKKPLLQRYSVFENLQPDEQLFVDDHNIGAGRWSADAVPFNWLQHFENIHDAPHFLWLHYFHSGPQFGTRYGEMEDLSFRPWQRLAEMNLNFRLTERGVTNETKQTLPDGRVLHTVVETVLPGVRGVPNPFGADGPTDSLGFVLPVDDTSFRIFTVLRGKDDGFFKAIANMRADMGKKLADDPHYFQRHPGDWEAQGSQGSITLHSEEHLASGDRGIVMLRRLLKQQVEIVAAGGDPMNVAFAPTSELVTLEAGQYLSAAPSAPAAAADGQPAKAT